MADEKSLRDILFELLETVKTIAESLEEIKDGLERPTIVTRIEVEDEYEE